tara:strand:+ start:316 stop:561 length:246 start_codon:yes stop_codon:yes gene_type:complete
MILKMKILTTTRMVRIKLMLASISKTRTNSLTRMTSKEKRSKTLRSTAEIEAGTWAMTAEKEIGLVNLKQGFQTYSSTFSS